MLFRNLITAAAFAALSLGGVAQAETPKSDKVDARQQARIDKGAENGKLTNPEERRLEARQGRSDRVEERAKADGDVTGVEKVHAAKIDKRNAEAIKRQKNDKQGN